MSIDPMLLYLAKNGPRFWQVRRRIPMGSDPPYEVGDRIDRATLLGWRNAILLIKQGWVVPWEPTRGEITAQRRAAARKSRKGGQDFKELVRRAMRRLAEPTTKAVWEFLLIPKGLEELTQQKPGLPIVSVYEEKTADRWDLFFVTADGRKGKRTRRSFSVDLARLKKEPSPK